ncbi:MAG: DUF6057 family protein, partial [Bacteroidales bacterium]|nr:DUF6057 family protein [Bacteroidales bacterium]
EQNLITLMKYNPDNRKVFEYLAAFLLLRKNLFEFQMLLDDYYFNMGYPQLPKAFEEAIIILIYNERKELVEKYNIPYSALERFVKFNEDISTVKSNTGISSLRNKYKESYWLYFKYWKPMTLDEITRSSVY